MEKLEEKIGYSFRDPTLLATALTHSSYANERHGAAECYERLEFLGDSILGFVAAERLYRLEPSLPEGRMTRLRAELVCEQSLHRVALELGLGAYMRLGRGEEHSGGRERPSILADMVEALIAAIFLDGGLEQARRFVRERVLPAPEETVSAANADYKTQLQELVQQKAGQRVNYELLSESGPDHNKRFTFCASVNGEVLGEGSGRTKKEAEQMAARCALDALKQ